MKGIDMNKTRIATALAAGIASLFAFSAHAGEFRVYNATSMTIVPYFKSNCWGTAFAVKPKGYVDFGNIAPGTFFPWDFADPALTDPSCKHPKVEFTYSFFHGPDVTPTDPPAWLKTRFDPTSFESVVVGGAIVAPPSVQDDD